MQFLICLLLPLCGVLGTLQMDKDLQYNCYYQILKKYSTKAYYDYDDDIEYNQHLKNTAQQSNTFAASSTESQQQEQKQRMRREIFKDHDDTSSIQDLHTNDLDKTYSSAYAEPRNSGNYKQAFNRPARPSLNSNSTKFSANETTIFNTKEVTYFIVASQTLRVGFVYKVTISVLQAKYPIKAFANISCDGVNLSGDSIDVYAGGSETLNLHVMPNALPKRACKLRLEGFFLNYYCDLAFLNEYALEYAHHSRMILIQTDKLLYMQGDTLRFRVTVIGADFQPTECILEIYLIDPHEHITWRWLIPLSSSGTIALEHALADRPIFGEWTISVAIADQGDQQKRTHFTVEEYYRTRCEVEVNMPAVFFTTSAFIKGTVTAITTDSYSKSINANLTLIATFYPLYYLDGRTLNKQYRLGLFANMDISPELYKHPKELLNRTAYILHENNKTARYNNDILSHGRRLFQQTVTQFNGSYNFKWSKFQLEKLQTNMTAVEILVTATIATDNGDEPCAGYAISRIYKPTMRISFLGGSPQIFKPTLPFTVFLAVEYISGSPLDSSLLAEGQMQVRGVISTKASAGKLVWPNRVLQMIHHRAGIWELKIDLRNDLPQLQHDAFNLVTQMQLQATFTVERQAGTKRAHNTTTSAELQLLAHFSPRNQHIKISSSTEQPTVGEYIIFEINANFFVEHFHYMVIAKDVILVSEREFFSDGMRTIALVLSAEMSPFAEIFVWAVTWQGQIIADSLTFPVSGMFRNNFTVTIENGHKNEIPISISGEAGTYVSLTAVARDIYNMQPDGFGMTYTAFITEMQAAYNNTSKLYKHGWYMHKDYNVYGKYDNVYYAGSTFAIDANSTFAQSGLIVFTDGVVPNTAEKCKQMGFAQCSIGSCYLLAKKCDGFRDCLDGSDEVACEQVHQPANEVSGKENYRFNRVFRHYQNAAWLWKDVQINTNGQSKFYAVEPSNSVTSQWIISGYSTRLAKGVGVISHALVYTSQKPIVVEVDMPDSCRQYEHIGMHVHIFKNTNTSITATVTLRESADYALVTDKYFQLPVNLAAHELQRTLLLFIMPISLGKIEVDLLVETSYSAINIISSLNVASAELDPQQRGWHKCILLNLMEHQSYIVEHLNISKIPHNHVHISLVQNAISAFIGNHNSSRSSFLETAEECALDLATNLYSLIYLRLMTNVHNATAEKNIYFHMNINYQRLLSFMRADGSFTNLLAADWNYLDSSVWLTAHCLRLIQEAAAYKMIDYIWIDVTIIEANLNWLLQQQTPEGAWLQKGISAEDSKNKITLTAHVLISFCSLQNLSDANALRVQKAKLNAIAWFKQNLHTQLNTTKPYEVALTTYALLLCKSTMAEYTLPILHGLARRSAESYIYWSSNDLEKSTSYSQRNECNSLDIETTAYALLTYLMRGDAQTEAIANWLNTNCLYGHGLISARATNAAIRALLEFYTHSRKHENSETVVELQASSTAVGTIKEILYLNNSNRAQLQSIELSNVVGMLEINANGTGSAILHVHFDTNADKVSQSSATPAFRINNKASFHGRQISHITHTICINWINAQQATNKGVTILDVMLPTGYGIQQQLLDTYVRSNSVKQLLRAKYMETRIIFYFIDLAKEDTCVQFTIRRLYPVANITRFLPLRVYNYNAPEHFASTMFDASPLHRLNISQVFYSSSCKNCLASSSPLIGIYVNLILLVLLFLFCLHSL